MSGVNVVAEGGKGRVVMFPRALYGNEKQGGPAFLGRALAGHLHPTQRTTCRPIFTTTTTTATTLTDVPFLPLSSTWPSLRLLITTMMLHLNIRSIVGNAQALYSHLIPPRRSSPLAPETHLMRNPVRTLTYASILIVWYVFVVPRTVFYFAFSPAL